MVYYIVNYINEIVGIFDTYTAARLYLHNNYEKDDITNLELKIVQVQVMEEIYD